MRYFLALALLWPAALHADVVLLGGVPKSVVIYPQIAMVTRQVPYSIPAGQSELVVTNLPKGISLQGLRVEVDGARLISTAARDDFAIPDDATVDPAVTKAEAEVERMQDALRAARNAVADIRAKAEAEEARIAFLRGLASSEATAGMSVDTLGKLAAMIGQETLAARIAALGAEASAQAAERQVSDAQEDLQRAEQALLALQTAPKDFASLGVTVDSADATDGVLTITYFTEASWSPTYDIHLTRSTGALRIQRGALVSQSSGEDWQDVTLTLSTAQVIGQTQPSTLFPNRRWIEEERSEADLRSMAEPVMEAPVIVEEAIAGPDMMFDGLVATYTFATPVTVANDADLLRLSLDRLDTTARLFARAVPSRDDTAFLMAEMTNDLGEPLLASYDVILFLDGQLSGEMDFQTTLPVGAPLDLPFGAIEGMRLSQITKDRNTGDTGVFTRATERTEAYTLKIENLTEDTWPVEVLHAVPFSEQDELEIEWTARPMPTEENDDDRRGIMRWDLDVQGKSETTVDLSYTFSWPEGQVLR